MFYLNPKDFSLTGSILGEMQLKFQVITVPLTKKSILSCGIVYSLCMPGCRVMWLDLNHSKYSRPHALASLFLLKGALGQIRGALGVRHLRNRDVLIWRQRRCVSRGVPGEY